MITVRGVYYYGLRDPSCQPFEHMSRKWPSALDLIGSNGSNPSVSFHTDYRSWEEADAQALKIATSNRRTGELWITVKGLLRGPFVTLGKKEVVGAFGVQGALPAELVVQRMYAFEAKTMPTYDYSILLKRRP
jgi:hypothetical protein